MKKLDKEACDVAIETVENWKDEWGSKVVGLCNDTCTVEAALERG